MSIIYTITDEAPALATYSLLPIISAYSKTAGVNVETRDISVAGRILVRHLSCKYLHVILSFIKLLPGEITWFPCDYFYQANFADVLPAEQRVPDALAELGALTLKKEVS
jgi:isocitrate dehydrogenase